MNYLTVDIYILEGKRKEICLVHLPIFIICLIIIAVDDARRQLERRFRLIDASCTLGLNKTLSYTGYIIVPCLDPSTQPRQEMSLNVLRPQWTDDASLESRALSVRRNRSENDREEEIRREYLVLESVTIKYLLFVTTVSMDVY